MQHSQMNLVTPSNNDKTLADGTVPDQTNVTMLEMQQVLRQEQE